MAKLDFNRVLRIALVLLSVGLVAGLALALWQWSKTEHSADRMEGTKERRALLSSMRDATSQAAGSIHSTV